LAQAALELGRKLMNEYDEKGYIVFNPPKNEAKSVKANKKNKF
jgi:hypothetical protein